MNPQFFIVRTHDGNGFECQRCAPVWQDGCHMMAFWNIRDTDEKGHEIITHRYHAKVIGVGEVLSIDVE